jgi:hypothetical protein
MNRLTLIISFFILTFCLSFEALGQQGSGFGLKGGLNYPNSGRYFRDAGQIFSKPGENMGYHMGIFFQITSYDIALRPELIYTKSSFTSELGQVDYQRVDFPVLAKLRFFKVISFQIGPSLHYTFEERFSEPENFEPTEPFGLGFQMGLGVNIGPVGLDLRFERELNERRYSFENVLGSEDFKNQQISLGLSFLIPSLKSVGRKTQSER